MFSNCLKEFKYIEFNCIGINNIIYSFLVNVTICLYLNRKTYRQDFKKLYLSFTYQYILHLKLIHFIIDIKY